MPQSLSKIYLHVVFGTKNRERTLIPVARDSLHAYLATVIFGLGCHAIFINSVEDHVHVLLELGRTVSVSEVVEDAKKSSSKWLKTQQGITPGFAWQNGYGVFSVSASNVEAVREYVLGQAEHHKKWSFQDEFRGLLKKHGVEFDERYVWD